MKRIAIVLSSLVLAAGVVAGVVYGTHESTTEEHVLTFVTTFQDNDPLPHPVTVTQTVTNTQTVTVTAPATTAPPPEVNEPPPATPAGWTRVLTEQWTGTTINESIWFLARYGYSSSIGCTAPEQNRVSGGTLKMVMEWLPATPPRAECQAAHEGPNWYVGGMRLQKISPYVGVNQRISVRWRLIPDNDEIISHRIIPMRWRSTAPSNIDGEEDWCEGHEKYLGCWTFIHWFVGDTGTVGTIRSDHYAVDLRSWNVFTVELDNQRARVWVNGVLRFDRVLTTDESPPSIPRILVLQQECRTETGGSGCPTTHEGGETIEVDYITLENRV
jgi:hypothetical protein